MVASFVSYITSPLLASPYNHGLDFVMSLSENRHANPSIVTAAVMLVTFMEILDTTVVNLLVPTWRAISAPPSTRARGFVTSCLAGQEPVPEPEMAAAFH